MTHDDHHGPSFDPERGTGSCTGPGIGRTGSSRTRIKCCPATSALAATLAGAPGLVVACMPIMDVVPPASMVGVALNAMNRDGKAIVELGIWVGGGPDAAARGPLKNRPRPSHTLGNSRPRGASKQPAVKVGGQMKKQSNQFSRAGPEQADSTAEEIVAGNDRVA